MVVCYLVIELVVEGYVVTSTSMIVLFLVWVIMLCIEGEP